MRRRIRISEMGRQTSLRGSIAGPLQDNKCICERQKGKSSADESFKWIGIRETETETRGTSLTVVAGCCVGHVGVGSVCAGSEASGWVARGIENHRGREIGVER